MALRKSKSIYSFEKSQGEVEQSKPSSEEQIATFTDEKKGNEEFNVHPSLRRSGIKWIQPKGSDAFNNINRVNEMNRVNEIPLPSGNNDSTSAGKGNIPPLFFDATVASSLYKEGWHKATILAVEPTKPTQLKDGSLCQRARFKWFLQDQQINLIDNVLLVHYQDSVIIQVINSCIQPNENRSQFDLLNLVNRQVMVRIEKTEKDNRNYFNVVEVKSLKNN